MKIFTRKTIEFVAPSRTPKIKTIGITSVDNVPDTIPEGEEVLPEGKEVGNYQTPLFLIGLD